jgi:serine/threonine protein kinase
MMRARNGWRRHNAEVIFAPTPHLWAPMDGTPSVRSGPFAGRYAIEREIGRGATATVYLARDAETGQSVAIKVLRSELAESTASDRFLREVRYTTSLQHPHILPVLDAGKHEGELFFVLPYMQGDTLRTRLTREKQLGVDEAVAIARTVAEALDYAHKRGLIHRDVKPENILFSATGETCLGDFGIARALEKVMNASTTSSGLVRGTPAYMSPEQASGATDYDGRSDVYSLGCVLYEMLAGIAAFVGPSAESVIAQRFVHAPRELRAYRPMVPPALEAVVTRALARSPADRFRTAGEFAEAMTKALADPAVELEPPPRTRVKLFADRRRVLWGVIAIVVVAAVGLRLIRRPHASSTPPDLRRIAVLDFEDQSPDRSLGYLTSGLTASLVHELTAFGPLTVLSRNGIRTLRDRALPLDSVVAAFRLGTLVEGSVQRSNDRLRVVVQLVDAHSNDPLESATIERPMGELFMLEDDLAHQVATLLRRRIGVELRVREMVAGTRSARARELVYRADRMREDAVRATASADTMELAAGISQLRSADSLLAAAEEADGRWIVPVIDRGWVALDMAYRRTGVPRVEAFRRAEEHANRALARDSTSATALELRGTSLHGQAARLELHDRDFADRLTRAEHDLKRALALDSSLATARGTLALVQFARGDVAEGARQAQTALAMDTYLKDAPTILGALYLNNLMIGETNNAWRWCKRAASEYPRDARFLECQLTLLAEDESKRPDPALAWRLVQQATALDPPARARAAGRAWLPIYREMMAAIVSARAGHRDSALAVARRARRTVADDAALGTDLLYEEAYLQLIIGDRKEATRLLSMYLAERPSLRELVLRHPRWRRLTSDPVFSRALREPQPDRR